MSSEIIAARSMRQIYWLSAICRVWIYENERQLPLFKVGRPDNNKNVRLCTLGPCAMIPL